MEKKTKRVFACVLSLILLLGCVQPAVAAETTADRIGNTWKQGGLSLVESIVSGALSGLNAIIPDRTNAGSAASYSHENFYEGTRPLLQTPADGARWSLGYACESLVPDDWQTHRYYLGGFIGIENWFSNKVENIIDDMCVRTIALSDGSGRGVSVFATIDAIGVSNADIRKIRALLASEAAKSGVELNAVCVTSTHCHSCIDTQGLWTDLFRKLFKNLGALLFWQKPEKGADEQFLSVLRQRTADAMMTAIRGMTPGKLTYAVKDIGEDYFNNKNRKSATSLPSQLHRFLFTPDDPSLRPTVIANLGAHPDIAGLPTGDNSGRELSGDYVYYLGETLASYGYNAMFFNGAIAGIYIGRGPTSDNVTMDKRYEISKRYGSEIARMLLALTMTQQQIMESSLYDEKTIAAERANAGRNGGGYTLWCENWQPVTERELPPVLNLRLKGVLVPVSNPLISAAGKLNLVNYEILRGEDGKFCIYTEIGYACFGDVPVVLVPGELVTDLYAGGASLTAQGSANGKDFGYPSLQEIFGADALCFGLCNDAIGYIVPDNDYKLAVLDDHYQELISLGAKTASTLLEGYLALASECGLR